VTIDAQLIDWDAASSGSSVAGRDDFSSSKNFSLGAEYRIQASEKIRIFPRAGVRWFDAPWDGKGPQDLPAINDLALFISQKDGEFLIASFGCGFGWMNKEGKARTLDLAGDIGGDAPSFAMSFTMEL
jgi:hypothetical protein